MDVTPRELRDIDIREGFRGYNRDDVDELLERAAATIEALNERVRKVGEQMTEVEGRQGKARETEEMLHRTLLLAQRAADEAVAEAQQKSRQILDEAESRARTTLAEAETTARRQAESERRRLESEVIELGARREALLADIDGLERFETEYRARLRRALEADLEGLAGKGSVAPSPRPAIHEVDLPAAAAAAAAAASPMAPVAPATPEPEPGGTAEPAPVAESGPATEEIASVPSWNLPAATEPTPNVAPAPTPAVHTPPSDVPPLPPLAEPPAARPPLFDEEPPEPETLDDEAFFASLREAVTDETPLGPRDDQPERRLFDQDDSKSGGLFRRRGR